MTALGLLKEMIENGGVCKHAFMAPKCEDCTCDNANEGEICEGFDPTTCGSQGIEMSCGWIGRSNTCGVAYCPLSKEITEKS